MPAASSPTNSRTRISSSLAASSVKVTAAMDLGAMPSASIMAMRPAMTAVLPEPAPASTRIERSWTLIAVRRAASSAQGFGCGGHHGASQTCAASPKRSVAAAVLRLQ